jgi:chromosome segregation ATPase
MDLGDEANALRSSVSTLNSEISQGEQGVASLEQEKRDLQALVLQYKGEISARESKHLGFQKQISEANRVHDEIATLKDVADFTTSSVKDANRELQRIKQRLDECSSLIQAKSIDVSTSAGAVERIAGLIGPQFVSTNIRRMREFRKQKEAMQQVSETLEKIYREVPLLLPSQEMKFLDIKPRDATVAPVVKVGDEIPDVCYF